MLVRQSCLVHSQPQANRLQVPEVEGTHVVKVLT